jgi:hypothetical protein
MNEIFLNPLMTGDLISVSYYEPESKKQTVKWKPTFSPVGEKLKHQPSAHSVGFSFKKGKQK